MNRPAPSVLDAIHRVVTPESVEFEFVLAGLYSRALAWLLDRMIILAVFLALGMSLAWILGGLGQLLSVTTLLLYFVLDWGYMVLFESLWAGQTPGKRTLGLRVLQEGGVRVGFEQVLLRNLARVVDGLPVLYGVGGVTTLLNDRHQRLGDLLAGTVVVRERRLQKPPTVHPPGDARTIPEPLLPQRVSRLTQEERSLVLDAVRRTEALDLEARLKLFDPLSARLEQSMALERPAHLSPENWCRWIAATLVKPVRPSGIPPG